MIYLLYGLFAVYLAGVAYNTGVILFFTKDFLSELNKQGQFPFYFVLLVALFFVVLWPVKYFYKEKLG